MDSPRWYIICFVFAAIVRPYLYSTDEAQTAWNQFYLIRMLSWLSNLNSRIVAKTQFKATSELVSDLCKLSLDSRRGPDKKNWKMSYESPFENHVNPTLLNSTSRVVRPQFWRPSNQRNAMHSRKNVLTVSMSIFFSLFQNTVAHKNPKKTAWLSRQFTWKGPAKSAGNISFM